MAEPSIDLNRNNALIWWNITLDNVLTEIDQLSYYCQQHNEPKRLEDLRILINQKGSAIADAGKLLENHHATKTSKTSSNNNTSSKNIENQQIKNEKKFQLRPDAPAFKPTSSVVESQREFEDISKSDSSNMEVETELILFQADKIVIENEIAKPQKVDENKKSDRKPIVEPQLVANGIPTLLKESSVFKDEWDDESVQAQVTEATEQVWAEAEAWVDAEAEAEENEWRILELGINRYVGLSDTNDSMYEDVPLGQSLFSKSNKKVTISSLANFDFGSLTLDSLEGLTFLDTSPLMTPQKSEDNESNLSPISTKSGIRFHSPTTSSGRSLHEKLSSPERKKRALSPAEALKRYEDKLSAAENNRDKNVAEKVQKAMIVVNRVKEKMLKQAERQVQAGEALQGKLKNAEQRHSMYLNGIKDKAGCENAKVNEVISLHTINTEALAQQLQQKLEEVENRILAANLRREQRLAGITCSQKKKNSRKIHQMSEFKLQLEKLKMERWEKLQKRFEAVQERQRKRLEELKRRVADAASISTPSAVNTPTNGYYSTPFIDKSNISPEIPTVDYNVALEISPVTQSSTLIHSPLALKRVDTGTIEEGSMESALLTPPSSAKYSDSKQFAPEHIFTPLMLDTPHIAPSSSQQQFQSGRSSVSLPILPSSLSSSLQDTYQHMSNSLYHKRSNKLIHLRALLWKSLLQCFSICDIVQHGIVSTSTISSFIYSRDVWNIARKVLSTTSNSSADKVILPLKDIVSQLQEPKKNVNVERVASSYQLYFSIIVDIRNVGLYYEPAINANASMSIPPSSKTNGEGTSKMFVGENMIATLNYIDLIEQINFLLQNTLETATVVHTNSGNYPSNSHPTPLSIVSSTPSLQPIPSFYSIASTNSGSGGCSFHNSKLHDFISSGGIFLLCILLSYEYGILSHGQVMTNIIEDIFYRHFSRSQTYQYTKNGDIKNFVNYQIFKENAITSWQVIDFPHLIDLLSIIVTEFVHPISSTVPELQSTAGANETTSVTETNHLLDVLGCGLPITLLELYIYFLQLQTTIHRTIDQTGDSEGPLSSEDDDLINLGPKEEECSLVIRYYSNQLLFALNVLLSTIVESVTRFDSLVVRNINITQPQTDTNNQLLTVLYYFQQYSLLSNLMTQIFNQYHLELLSLQIRCNYSSNGIQDSAFPPSLFTDESTQVHFISTLQFFENVMDYICVLLSFSRFVKSYKEGAGRNDIAVNKEISWSAFNTLNKQYWSFLRRSQALSTLFEMIYTIYTILHNEINLNWPPNNSTGDQFSHSTSNNFFGSELFAQLITTLVKGCDTLEFIASTDIELLKTIPLDSKKTYLNTFHRLTLLFVAFSDQKWIPSDVVESLSSHKQPFHSKYFSDERNPDFSLSASHTNIFEHLVTTLFDIIAAISYHDRDVRQHLSVAITIDSRYFPNHILKYLLPNSPEPTIATNNLSISWISSTCCLPIRYYKESKFKHSIIPCLVISSLEMENHIVMIKTYKKDKYVKKYIDYLRRENDCTGQDSTEDLEDNKHITADELKKRSVRLQKVYDLLPKNIWNIVYLEWLDKS